MRSQKSRQSTTASRTAEEDAPKLLEDYEKSPLTDVCSLHDGQLWLIGNRTLISLNLSRNRIGELGFRALLEAVEYQLKPIHGSRQATTGLKRLVLHRNAAPDNDDSVRKINRYMQLKDPFFRSPNVNLSKHNITPCSIPVIF